MKKMSCVLLAFLGITSCKKNDLGVDNGCISRITRHYVSAADSTAAAKLLLQNNIPVKNLVFFRTTLNDTITNTQGQTHIDQEIFSLQYFNGLPVFSSDIGFFFIDSVFQNSSGTRYNAVNLSSSPILSLPQVRKLFENAATLNSGSAATTIAGMCLDAEFGYYDLNAGIQNASPNFVKAWSVTPTDANYPLGIFRDDNGKTILYTSGIETLN